MSEYSRTYNYEIHPLDVVEKMVNAHGPNKNFAILRMVFGSEMPAEIIQKYKSQIIKHNESQINTRFPTVGFPLITTKDIVFDQGFSTKMVGFDIKTEMWYRNNDSYDFCAFNILPATDLVESPIMVQDLVIEAGFRDSLAVPFRYFPKNLDEKWVLKSGSQSVKIYHPTLCLLYILVENDETALTPTI